MSRQDHRAQPTKPGFPRVSGDEPATNDSAITTILFSPRERG